MLCFRFQSEKNSRYSRCIEYSGRFYTACPAMETVDSGMMETAIPEMQNQWFQSWKLAFRLMNSLPYNESMRFYSVNSL